MAGRKVLSENRSDKDVTDTAGRTGRGSSERSGV